MDCYFHNAVPSIAVCRDCQTSICATCRDERGTCPSCRLDERINAATAARERLNGTTGPASPPPGFGAGARPQAGTASAQASAPPPHAEPPPHQQYQQQWWAAPGAAPAPARRTTALARVAPETRGLLAAGYPLWPLAALALLGPRTAPEVRRQAVQAIAFNFGCYGLWFALGMVAHIPLLGLSAFPLLALLVPAWFVASVVYGIKVWHGDDVRVPIVSEWLDERDARAAAASAAAGRTTTV